MKLSSSQKSNVNSELIVIFKENLDQLVRDTKYSIYQDILKKSFFKADNGEVLPFLRNDKTIILLGLGNFEEFIYSELDNAITPACKYIKKFCIREISININYIVNQLVDVNKLVCEIIRTIISELYVFDYYKSKKLEYKLEALEIVYAGEKDLRSAMNIGSAIACGQNYAKDLQNFPPNICNTDYMLNEARELISKHEKFNLDYLDQNEMMELGMECALAVGQGSDMPNYTVCIEYSGGSEDIAPIVLVGKGIVFDNGGLCIKPSSSMLNMKMDMGGAATVLGTMKTLAMLNLPINVIGVIGLAENAVDARSYRPGDVLKSMKGITVEVSNTDAEGRLLLCDMLTYIEKYKPRTVIDIATLTGTIVVSLGDDFSGMFSNSNKLAKDLEKASYISNDLVWRLPLHKPYLSKIKSNIADIDHCNKDRDAGSIVAALFLSKFTENYEWAHLDIAGSAMGDFSNCKASGRPVPLLTHYLLSKVN